MKPIVFLDIDGVLAHHRFDRERARMQEEGEIPSVSPQHLWHNDHAVGLFHLVDARCVERLQRICESVDAEVVISSSWREAVATPLIADILRAKGLRAVVVGQTITEDERKERNLLSAVCSRGEEIALWLHDHGRLGAPFVALDDTADLDAVEDHFVQTTLARGLEEHHVTEAIAVLLRVRVPPRKAAL